MSVKDNAEHIEKVAAEMEHISSGTNMALTEMRIQFETLAEMQKEERFEMQKRADAAVDKQRKHDFKIIIGLIATLFIFIGGVIGIISYSLMNFDIEFGYSYEQNVNVGGDGNSTIYDGIHYNGN